MPPLIEMIKKRALVTGSCGPTVFRRYVFISHAGYAILGVDNNQRAGFFGPEGDTSWSLKRVHDEISDDQLFNRDRDRDSILQLMKETAQDVIVHNAAQPSHDRAADIVFDHLPQHECRRDPEDAREGSEVRTRGAIYPC